jgi:general L-amino acid transport system permease protein
MTTLHTVPTSAPSKPASTPTAWLRKNLFNSWFNSLLTIAIVLILGRTLFGFISWATSAAKWQVIPANLPIFFVGRFPADQYWRLDLMLAIIAGLGGFTWGVVGRNQPKLLTRNLLIGFGILALVLLLLPTSFPYRLVLLAIEAFTIGMIVIGKQVGNRSPAIAQWLPLAWVLTFFIALWLMRGGFGLDVVPTTAWGGWILTIFMSVVSIVLSFPFGVLLALGRQSSLPVIHWLCTAYIEIIRGIPLISILFIGLVMVPLFLPAGSRPDLVLRAILGLTLFAAAYQAETIRGGLQAIPKGQTEAANALGLNTPLTLGLIVLPQALKISIPAIVGLFISLLQDTTLVAIVGLSDLLGISRSILANPLYIGRYAEVYLFIGALYWAVCYIMSWAARRLEARLNSEH